MSAPNTTPILASSPAYTINLHMWGFVHKWSSLICTLFLLMLCLTGAPLIFYDEIETALGDVPTLPELNVRQNAQRISMDVVADNALKVAPNKVIQFILIDKDDDREIAVIVNDAINASNQTSQTVLMDARTGQVAAPPKPDFGFMAIMFSLHTDLFAGLAGTFFLGAMGLLFLVAIISGVVLYAPFMRKLKFAQVRSNKTRQIKWLDWHNLIGIVTLAWASVVGFTGLINTIGEPMFKLWQNTQMASMIAPFQTGVTVSNSGSIQTALENAKLQLPNKKPFVISMPGTPFAGAQHFNIFMRGVTPVTSKLFQPVFLNAANSQFAVTQPMPWYMQALFISEPLHFGNYGGLPLKIIWLLLDLLTIVILVSGLYLWWKKRSKTN